jgi:hypothetical protein
MEKLDERTENAVEVALKDELMRNERVFKHPSFGTLKLQRPTPRQERDIAEARRRQYHKDLKDPSILSKSELEKEAIRRGIWSSDRSEKLSALQNRIGQIMGLLDSVGYESVDTVLDKYNRAIERLRSFYENNQEAQDAITRYFHLDEKQNLEDYNYLFKNATTTEIDEVMSESQLFRTQIELLSELSTARKEMRPLMEEHVRLNMDSIESRMDRVEQLAKLYYCTTTEDGKPVWPSFDAMWDAAPKELELVLEEMWCFDQGIPDEQRKILGRHGFMLRAPTEVSSEGSPGTPQPNFNGESVQSEQTSSSVSTE